MPSRTLYIIYSVFCRLCMRCGAWYWSIQFVDVLYAAWLMQLSLQSLGRKETPTSDGNHIDVHVHVATDNAGQSTREESRSSQNVAFPDPWQLWWNVLRMHTRFQRLFTGGPSSSMYMYSASLQSHTAIDLIEVNRE